MDRGSAIEQALGGNLPPGFPTIDRFVNGVATSIKSVDTTAATYQNAGALASKLNGFVDDLAAFKGGEWSTMKIGAAQITGRELVIAVPPGSVSPAQAAVIEAATSRGASMGVSVVIKEVP